LTKTENSEDRICKNQIHENKKAKFSEKEIAKQKALKAKLQRLNRKTKNAKAEMPKQKQKAGGRETPPAFF